MTLHRIAFLASLRKENERYVAKSHIARKILHPQENNEFETVVK